MKSVIITIVSMSLILLSLGCSPAQTRDYGVQGYRLYTNWIADSPYWPDDVERLTDEQVDAFAKASWAEHERVYNWVDEQLKDD